MPTDCLRKLRLLCEDFPRSHNLVLIGQPLMLQSLALSVNEEIRSRVTYSVLLPHLAPETLQAFILGQLNRAGLGHNTFTPEALDLSVRSADGLLRRTRNLCLGLPYPQSVFGLVDRSGARSNPHRRSQTSQPRPDSTPLEERL